MAHSICGKGVTCDTQPTVASFTTRPCTVPQLPTLVVQVEPSLQKPCTVDASDDAPVVRLVNSLIADAVRKGASDIHIEPYEKVLRVRFRIDGTLYEMMAPPFKFKLAIISRLKIMSELDIAERRVPQDGRFKANAGGREIDFRVSIIAARRLFSMMDQPPAVVDRQKGASPAGVEPSIP